MANLVAKRVALLKSPEERALIWFLQLLSWTGKGLAQVPVAGLEIYCLDPDAKLSEEATEAVLAFRAQWLKERARGRVQTSIGKRVAEALDYTRSARTISIIDGPARTGKTFEARAWCEQSAGLARYVEVPCARDDTAFLHRIAKALGVSINLNSKAQELRARIESVLEGGDLMLVMDEAHYLWPQGRMQFAFPGRVNFINTVLANYGVPVALVTTPQFYDAQKYVEKHTRWNSDQFVGRIGHVERLPERLSEGDLMAVAAALLPEGNPRVYLKLAVYAGISRKHLASIEAIIKRARWLAKKRGRQVASPADVDEAINESVIPTDSALATVLGQSSRAKRDASASEPPRLCGGGLESSNRERGRSQEEIFK